MVLDLQLLFLLNGVVGQSSVVDAIIVFFASYLAYLLVAFFLALLVFSQYERRKKWELFLVVGISVVVARLGITELIRFFYHRPRPFLEQPVHQLFTDSAWSFPSGHAAFFFAMATAIYLYNKKWGIGFFIATLLITVSRVIAGVHYPSDILGGALIGILVAYGTFAVVRRVVVRSVEIS